MADIKITTKVEITATIEFTENQLAALDAMAGYGADAFLKAFYVKLGKHYMKPFERDLRELFQKIESDVSPHYARHARRENSLRTHCAKPIHRESKHGWRSKTTRHQRPARS